MRGISADNTIRSLQEDRDARNERKRRVHPTRQSLDSVTACILSVKTDLNRSIGYESTARTSLQDKAKGTAEIRVRIVALETRKHQQLLDLSPSVVSTALHPSPSAASAARQSSFFVALAARQPSAPVGPTAQEPSAPMAPAARQPPTAADFPALEAPAASSPRDNTRTTKVVETHPSPGPR